MSAEVLSGMAGAVLSLAFSYVPGLEARYKALDGTMKRLVMLALLILVAGAILGLACAGLGEDFGVTVTCDRSGLIGLIQILGAAVIANQAVYAISPRTK